MKTPSISAPRDDSRLPRTISLMFSMSPKLTLHILVGSSFFWKVLSVLFLALKICNNVNLEQRKWSQLLWKAHPFLLRLAVLGHGDQCQWLPGRTSCSRERLTFSFLMSLGPTAMVWSSLAFATMGSLGQDSSWPTPQFLFLFYL